MIARRGSCSTAPMGARLMIFGSDGDWHPLETLSFCFKISFPFSFIVTDLIYERSIRIGTQQSFRTLTSEGKKIRIAIAGCLRRFSACIVFITDSLPPIRHVAGTSAVKLLRNVVVTPWAHASTSLFAFKFRVRNWRHIVGDGDFET